MNMTISVIKHSEIKDFESIVKLKQQHWPYSYESQLQWVKDNLRDDDEHICLYMDDDIIAYLNFVKIVCHVNGGCFNSIGLGNVCVAKVHRNRGWGIALVSFANCILKERKIPGILLCHNELISFYQKCGWRTLVDIKEISIADKFYNGIAMSYNCIAFSDVKTVEIDRNF